MISYFSRLKPFLALVILLSLISFSSPAHATSTEYSSYKKLKLGMTATDVAKSLYGKSYKKYIKKEHGVMTLNHKVVLSEIKDDYALYAFSFYPYDEKKRSLVFTSHASDLQNETKRSHIISCAKGIYP